ILEFSQKIRNEILKDNLIDELSKQASLNKTSIKTQIKKYKSSISGNYELRFDDIMDNKLIPFIEKSTSSYAYYDQEEGDVYVGVGKEMMEPIMESEGQYLPSQIPVLKLVFDVHNDNKVDL